MRVPSVRLRRTRRAPKREAPGTADVQADAGSVASAAAVVTPPVASSAGACSPGSSSPAASSAMTEEVADEPLPRRQPLASRQPRSREQPSRQPGPRAAKPSRTPVDPAVLRQVLDALNRLPPLGDERRRALQLRWLAGFRSVSVSVRICCVPVRVSRVLFRAGRAGINGCRELSVKRDRHAIVSGNFRVLGCVFSQPRQPVSRPPFGRSEKGRQKCAPRKQMQSFALHPAPRRPAAFRWLSVRQLSEANFPGKPAGMAEIRRTRPTAGGSATGRRSRMRS
jgi:hypothetical protein